MFDADTLVIGSGAGGLTAALALARAGERVLVLEQHSKAGGLCHCFMRSGHRFSPGVHYLGQLGPGGSLRKIYEGLGVAQDLAFFQMNPDGFEHVRLGDLTFDLPSGLEPMIERYQARFPMESGGIRNYLSLLDTVCREMSCIPETRTFLEFLTVPFRTRNMGRYGLYSLERILKDRISDPLLRSLLAFQCGDHGLPPSKIPFIMHAPVAGHYLDGGYYPLGGGAAIPKALLKGLRAQGGDIRLSSPVDVILTERSGSRRQAIGVRLREGEELRARRIISNATPHQTYRDLVGEEHLSAGLRRKLASTQYSIAALSLFLITDLDLAAMGMDSGNYWFAPHHDLEAVYAAAQEPAAIHDNLPALFFGITSLKDPSSAVKGQHSIEAVRFMAYDVFKPFEHSSFGKRPEAYQQLKQHLTATMMNSLEKVIPGIGKHILHCELGTPLTHSHYVRSTEGGCYGTAKLLRQIGPFAFKQDSEIEHLHLCGASMLHGVSGAATSGLMLAAGMLGCRPSELLNARDQGLKIYSAGLAHPWSGVQAAS